MSWATCYSGSNNIDKNSPARMDDGRFFTNYNLYYESEPSYKASLKMKSNHQYRKYLTDNAENVMKKTENCHVIIAVIVKVVLKLFLILLNICTKVVLIPQCLMGMKVQTSKIYIYPDKG